MEKNLQSYGFTLSKSKTHAKEYRTGDIVIYSIPSSRINLVVSPEDYLFMKNFECCKYHNSNLSAFPKEQNNGENKIHFGYKIEFENIYSMNEFLCQYMKYKKKS